MDEYSGKRTGDGLVVPAVFLRNNGNNRDQNSQLCTQVGCSGRLNSAKGIQIPCPEKGRPLRPSFQSSSSGKEVTGSSSRSCSASNTSNKCLEEPYKKLSPYLETDSSETSSVQDGPEVTEFQGGLNYEFIETGSHEIMSMEVESSSLASNTRLQRNFKKSAVGNPDNLVGTPVSLASKSSIHGSHSNASRYGLTNVKCNSVTDVPSGSSVSVSNPGRRKEMVKMRSSDGESSSTDKGKKMNGLAVEGRNPRCSPGISISDSRQCRNGTTNRDSIAASFRTRRALSGCTRARVANPGTRINLSSNESDVLIPQMSEPDIAINMSAPSSSHKFSRESSFSQPSSCGRPDSSNDSLRGIRLSSPTDIGHNRSSLNPESFRCYNMDGIAEVLLALERIEQDEELTYEQLLVLETNLFLNGLSFYDQHREMRLDIDNMSYEELLALEERMGTVSTALPEEALSKCLETSTYVSAFMEDATTNCCSNGDDIKCSVCQEEYTDGDEVGRLKCQHMYHVVCIHEWLRLKNWCPVCKASMATSSIPSS